MRATGTTGIAMNVATDSAAVRSPECSFSVFHAQQGGIASSRCVIGDVIRDSDARIVFACAAIGQNGENTVPTETARTINRRTTFMRS